MYKPIYFTARGNLLLRNVFFEICRRNSHIYSLSWKGLHVLSKLEPFAISIVQIVGRLSINVEILLIRTEVFRTVGFQMSDSIASSSNVLSQVKVSGKERVGLTRVCLHKSLLED